MDQSPIQGSFVRLSNFMVDAFIFRTLFPRCHGKGDAGCETPVNRSVSAAKLFFTQLREDCEFNFARSVTDLQTLTCE